MTKPICPKIKFTNSSVVHIIEKKSREKFLVMQQNCPSIFNLLKYIFYPFKVFWWLDKNLMEGWKWDPTTILRNASHFTMFCAISAIMAVSYHTNLETWTFWVYLNCHIYTEYWVFVLLTGSNKKLTSLFKYLCYAKNCGLPTCSAWSKLRGKLPVILKLLLHSFHQKHNSEAY